MSLDLRPALLALAAVALSLVPRAAHAQSLAPVGVFDEEPPETLPTLRIATPRGAQRPRAAPRALDPDAAVEAVGWLTPVAAVGYVAAGLMVTAGAVIYVLTAVFSASILVLEAGVCSDAHASSCPVSRPDLTNEYRLAGGLVATGLSGFVGTPVMHGLLPHRRTRRRAARVGWRAAPVTGGVIVGLSVSF